MVQLAAPGDHRERRNRSEMLMRNRKRSCPSSGKAAFMEYFVANETQEGRPINRRIDLVISPPIQAGQ